MSVQSLLMASAISLSVIPSISAHEFVYSPESAQRTNANTPVLKANMDTVPYSYLLYGFQLEIKLEGATFNTTNVNAIRNATQISSPNVFLPYRVTNNSAKYRISGEHDLRALNYIELTLDQSVLSTPNSLSITLPIFHDIAPPDVPHSDANTVASLNVGSVNATDFLNNSGIVFTAKLNEGKFLPGCADPIARSIMKTSNIQGIVRVWRKTESQVEFIVEGGHYIPDSGNWNFELSPDTNTLNKTLHVSTAISYK